MNRETLEKALEAEANEQIECPVCGDQIPASELATDHAHTNELIAALLDALPEESYKLFHANSDGSIDDIAGEGFWHLEQMKQGHWYFGVDAGDTRLHKYRITSDSPIRVEMYDPDERKSNPQTGLRDTDESDHPDPELVKQAETVLSLVRATMYPVAHGEAHRLKEMLEERQSEDSED